MADVAGYSIIRNTGQGEADVSRQGYDTAIGGILPPPAPNPVEVLLVTPTDGTVIDPDEVVGFDVRSLTKLRRVLVTATFPGYHFSELVYSGYPGWTGDAASGGFTEVYPTSSVEWVTGDGSYYRYRFQLRRAPLWPDSPTISVVAVNRDGQEGTL